MVAISAKTKRDIKKMMQPRAVERVLRGPPIELTKAVNDQCAAHGVYVPDGLRGTRNLGHSPVARWIAAGKLNETQITAIDRCIALWERAGKTSGLVMDMDKIAGGQPSSGLAQQEALDQLARIKSYFPGRLRSYWEIFEDVCRFDRPAGSAGSELATNRRSAIDYAQFCVRFVADVVAQQLGL